MQRLLLFSMLLVLMPGRVATADEEGSVKRTFQIDLSVREPMKPQDWSGKVAIENGRIVKVEKTSGSSDSINADMSWEIVYGRSLRSDPKTLPRAKALLISVEAPADGTLSIETRGGDFSFRVDEIPEGKKVEFLQGQVTVSLGQQLSARRSGPSELPPAVIAGEFPARPITQGKLQSDWPAVAVSPSGVLWCAFIQWDGKAGDRVLVSKRSPGKPWARPVALEDGSTDHYWPAVGLVGETAVVVWSAQRDGNFDLYTSTVDPRGAPSPAEQLTDTPQTDLQARIASDGKETLTLVWQSFREGASDVYAKRFTADGWGPEHRVSPSEANDWQPDVAVDSLGSAWISWDGYQNGNYDVFLRRLDSGGLGPVIPITSEPTAQFHSTVAVDGKNRIWVAWDDGGENWGKDLSATSAAEGNQGLHASRSIGLRVVVDVALLEPEMQPGAALTGRMRKFAELPRLAVDGRGTLWMVFRHWTTTRPTEMYDVYATRLAEEGWSTPWKLAASSGRNSQWAAIAPAPGGNLTAVYASDGRSPDNLPTDQIHSLIYTLQLAELAPGDGMPAVELAGVKLPQPSAAFVRRARPTMTVGEKTYTLVLGDCHRHTDIRGHSAVDGSIMDTFRYALDAGQLDYMGLGDHNEVFGGKWPDGLRDYQWWWTQKAVDLFTSAPRFVGIYSYEHSMSRPGGHRNILFLKRGAPLRMIDRDAKVDPNPANLPPELWKWIDEKVLAEPGQKCVIVPHTFASGPLADWNWPNARFDCLLEIYQGCRGSYEKWGLPPGEKRGGTQTQEPGHFAQDALERGNVYGFVSFSDHRSTHNSWGCVWVDRISREGILDAMLARRTYAASDEILLKVTADGRFTMGQVFEAPAGEPPALEIEIEAPDEILRVDVIKNGMHVWSKNPNARSLKAVFRDFDVTPGNAYYYVRVFQRDTEAPDGDPEIAWSSPMFVTYR
jgi:hypothetical protein